MSQKTHFQATPTLLFEREALHGLVDTLWKRMVLTRNEVYEEMGLILGRKDVHISDMSEDDMRKVVKVMQPKVANCLHMNCLNCEHGYPSTIGLYRCGYCGSFSLTYKEDGCCAITGNGD